METVFTSPAWLAGKTAVHDADDAVQLRESVVTGLLSSSSESKFLRVADSTFNLTLEMQTNVLLEQSETIYDASVL